MSFDFDNWFRDAVQLSDQISEVVQLLESPEPASTNLSPFSYPFDSDSVEIALKQLLDEVRALRVDELREGYQQLLPSLMLALVELGSIEMPSEGEFALSGDELIGVRWDRQRDGLVERRQPLLHFAGEALLHLCDRIKSWGPHFAEQQKLIDTTDVFYWRSRAEWLQRANETIRRRLAYEQSWLLNHTTHLLVTTQGGATPPSPPKEKNKGGRRPETTPERAEQVVMWWEEFKANPEPEGYQTPSRLRKGSVDDFIAWGEFRKLQDFPKNSKEVNRCKKRHRDLHPPKSAKTKMPKRR
jgi:hypothetical protein